MLLPAARLLLRALLRHAVLLIPLGLLRGLLGRALRLLLDALLLLWCWLPALLRRLLGVLRLLLLLLLLLLLNLMLPLRRLLLHSLLLLRRLRGMRWLRLGGRLLRALRPLLLDLRLRLYPLRRLLLHSWLLGCRLWRMRRRLRPLCMLLLSRPAALLLTFFVFLVLRVDWYHRCDTQKEHRRTRYS